MNWKHSSRERGPKSSVDLLEHVTDGGVHVDTSLLGDYSRESILVGVVSSESGSDTHYLEKQEEPRRSGERRPHEVIT